MNRFRFALAAAFLILGAHFALAQNKVTVSDTIYNADGTVASGTLALSWPAFTSADGYTIAQGTLSMKIINGVINVSLVPTQGASPPGVSYTATYFLQNKVTYTEYWTIPATGPVTVAQVRTTPVPTPTVIFGEQQLTLGTGMSALLGFWRPSVAPTATAAGQCYWDTTNDRLLCSSAGLTFSPLSGGSMSGTAGGDLTGTYPNPKIAPGTANQLMKTRSDGTSREWAALLTGTAGSDFGVAYSPGTITLNLPDAGPAARGAVTTRPQTFAGNKTIQDALGIGSIATGAKFSAQESGAKTADDYAAYISNTATSSTASINKYGLYVASTGTWNGANNYGLFVADSTGGTNNWAIKTGTGLVEFGDKVVAKPTTNQSAANHIAVDGESTVTGGSSYVMGVYGAAIYNAASGGNSGFAVQGEAYKSGASTSPLFGGIASYAEVDGGTVTDLVGLLAYGNLRSAGTVMNNYGILVQNQDGVGTNNWAIKTGTGKVEFGDIITAQSTSAATAPAGYSANTFNHTKNSTQGIDWPAVGTSQDNTFSILSNVGTTGQAATKGNHVALQVWERLFAFGANNEFAPAQVILDNRSGTPARMWGTDNTVLGSASALDDAIAGPVWVVNRFVSGSLPRRSMGGVFHTKPGHGGGIQEVAGRENFTTYPIDVGLWVEGWSGAKNLTPAPGLPPTDGQLAARTDGFITGIRVGGGGDMWDGSDLAADRSRFTTGIEIKDFTASGLTVHAPYPSTTPNGIAVGDPGVTGIITAKQFQNAGNVFAAQRFTDTSPGGYFFRAVNAANDTNMFSIDVLGNLSTVGSVSAGSISTTGNVTAGGQYQKGDNDGYLVMANRGADGGNYGVYFDSSGGSVQVWTNSGPRVRVNSSGSVLPGATGQPLGSTSARWDIFAQSVNVATAAQWTGGSNPTCSTGDYFIWANSTDLKLKKCQNGTITDLDTASAGGGYEALKGDTGTATRTGSEAIKVAGTSGEISTSATDGTDDTVTVSLPATLSTNKTVSATWTFSGTLVLPTKTDPGSPTLGEAWINSTQLKFRDNGGTPATRTVVSTDDTQTLTNKTLTTPTIGDFSNATHNHQSAGGGGTLDAAALATGTLALARGGTNQGTWTAARCVRVNAGGTALEAAAADCGSGGGSQHQVNGANVISNDPINFQDTATMAFTNPSAGNIQAAVKADSIGPAQVDETANYTWSGTESFTGTLVLPKKTDPASPTAGEIWVNAGVPKLRDNAGTPATRYMGVASSALTSGQFVQGGGNGDLSASGFSAVGAGAGAGIGAYNAGTATTLARSDHTHRHFATLTWYFAGTPSTGVQNLTLALPEGITNPAITDMRVTVNTTSASSSTFNIQRCTAGCTGTSPTFSNIYSANLTLSASTRTAAKAAAPDQNVSGLAAGDQLKANLVTIGSGLADVTVTMTIKYETTN